MENWFNSIWFVILVYLVFAFSLLLFLALPSGMTFVYLLFLGIFAGVTHKKYHDMKKEKKNHDV